MSLFIPPTSVADVLFNACAQFAMDVADPKIILENAFPGMAKFIVRKWKSATNRGSGLMCTRQQKIWNENSEAAVMMH